MNEKLKDKATILPQNPIHLDSKSEPEPEPDIAIAKFSNDDYRSHHPNAEELFLVIEVADSSLAIDRTVKTPLYAKAGIPEYWIVNIQDRQIEVFSKPENGAYQISKVFKKGNLSCSSIEFDVMIGEVF